MKAIHISSYKQLEKAINDYITNNNLSLDEERYYQIKYLSGKTEKEDIVCFADYDNGNYNERRVRYLKHNIKNEKDFLKVLKSNYSDLNEESLCNLLENAKACTRDGVWYEIFYNTDEESFLPINFDIVNIFSPSECVDFLIEKEKNNYLDYVNLRNDSQILDWARRVSSVEAYDKEDEFIRDIVAYGLIDTDPEHKKWFVDAFDCEQPVYVYEINRKMHNELSKVLKDRISDKKLKDKWSTQRAERGYSDCDSWNIYSWFIEIMTPALKQMRKNLHGFPTSISINPNVNSQEVQIGDEKSDGMKDWEEVLDRMIFLLEEMDEDKCSFKNPVDKDVEKARRKFEKKYGFWGEKFEELNGIKNDNEHGKRMYFYSDDPEHPEWKELSSEWFKYEAQIASYRDKCREEFFQLFSLHFWDLWD